MPSSSPAAAGLDDGIAVHDDSALYGLIDRIQDLALHLVSINELTAPRRKHR